MSFGSPGDHPITDMLRFGKHPFPVEFERLLMRINRLNPRALDGDVALFAYDWEQGKNLVEGRQLLEKLLAQNESKS
jgi:hypothetical protein